MNYRRLMILVFLLIIPSGIFAKSGPPIPVPKLSISEAASLASSYFYNQETRVRDQEYFKKSEYIIVAIEYTNDFTQTPEDKEWAWKIMFIHPAQNDHHIVYKVTNDKQVVFLYGSE